MHQMKYTINRINAPNVYSYNRSELPAFIRDPAFIKSCFIGLLRKVCVKFVQLLTGYNNKLIFLQGLSNSFNPLLAYRTLSFIAELQTWHAFHILGEICIRDIAFIGDLAFNWDPVLIRTINLDPRRLFETGRLFGGLR